MARAAEVELPSAIPAFLQACGTLIEEAPVGATSPASKRFRRLSGSPLSFDREGTIETHPKRRLAG